MTISKKRKFPRESMQISPFFQRIHGDFTIFPRRIDLKIEGKPESNLSFDYEKKHLAGVSISGLFCRKILSKWYRDVTCLLSLLLMPYCIFLREVTPKCVVSPSSFPHFFQQTIWHLGRLHAMRLTKFFAGAWRPKSSWSAGVLVGWSIIGSRLQPLPQLMGFVFPTSISAFFVSVSTRLSWSVWDHRSLWIQGYPSS